jgi:hypothetical protein
LKGPGRCAAPGDGGRSGQALAEACFEERLAGLEHRERAGRPRRFPPEEITRADLAILIERPTAREPQLRIACGSRPRAPVALPPADTAGMTRTAQDADRDRRGAWLIAGTVALAATDWIATWLLIDQTAEGTTEVAGLSEGNLRALQNPGTLLLLLSLRTGWRRYGARRGEFGTAGFTITALALVIVLVGNIVEFGLWGDGPLDSQDPGAAIFFSGLLVLAFGLVLLSQAVMRSAWRRTRRQR